MNKCDKNICFEWREASNGLLFGSKKCRHLEINNSKYKCKKFGIKINQIVLGQKFFK